MLSSLEGKEKDVSKKIFSIYIAPFKTEDTEVLGRQRAKPSKIKAQGSKQLTDL